MRSTALSLACLFSAFSLCLAEEKSLFDGKSLGEWKVVENFDFRNHGKVEVRDGTIVLEKGKPGTAVRFAGKMPKSDYEISLEAMRVDGDDFFCGMTFPVGDAWLSLIVGGWGGRVVGLSCLDDEPAVDNETCQHKEFKNKQWYKIRLRVTKDKVQAWIDGERLVDIDTKDRKLSIWFEQECVTPLGIATWRTSAALKNLKLTTFGEDDAKNEKPSPKSETNPKSKIQNPKS